MQGVPKIPHNWYDMQNTVGGWCCLAVFWAELFADNCKKIINLMLNPCAVCIANMVDAVQKRDSTISRYPKTIVLLDQ